MCRYAFTSYKPHLACFKCQKTFKRKLLKDIAEGINASDDEIPPKCPNCGELMADMGLDFKSPKKNDNNAWKHLKTLYQVGITFHSCGCSGPGYIPRDINQLIKHFEKIKENYLTHQHFWAQRAENLNTQSEIDKDMHQNWKFLQSIPRELKHGKHNYDAKKAQVYWNKKVQEVEVKLQQITN